MDTEILFTEQKWNILSLLSKERLSPLQLSKKSNTTMANISQQLRLLEASSLVGKTKIPNRDKGKPRTLFHLTKDFAYMINVNGGFAGKKMIELDQHHKSIMSIWFVKDRSLHYFLEKWLWKIEPHMPMIDAILFNDSEISARDSKIILYLVSKKEAELRKKLAVMEIKNQEGTSKSIVPQFLSSSSLKSDLQSRKAPFSDLSSLLVIYDSEKMVDNSIREFSQQLEVR